MNRSFHNIEYKPLPGGKYRIGYDASGNHWYIRKFRNRGSSYHYACTRITSQGHSPFTLSQGYSRFTRDTLAEVSKELEQRNR